MKNDRIKRKIEADCIGATDWTDLGQRIREVVDDVAPAASACSVDAPGTESAGQEGDPR